jgi:hypothetical protein
MIKAGAAAIVAFGLAAGAQAQEQGLKQVATLVKKATATVKAIEDTRLQLQRTMDVYNAVLAPDAKDRRGSYSKLLKEIETTKKKRAEITRRANEMDIEADALFKSWSDSTSAISDASLRTRSEERLATTKSRYAEIRAAGTKAEELYAPFMNHDCGTRARRAEAQRPGSRSQRGD